MESIRHVVQEMKEEEKKLLQQRIQRQQQAITLQNLIFSSGVLVNFLLFYLIYYAIRQELQSRTLLEITLQTANEGLETKVAERTAELTLMNEQLRTAQAELRAMLTTERELSDMKSRIITTVSHEYRTPLMTIIGSAELLQKYADKMSADKKAVHFERIRKNTKHMTSLVNDVLFISSSEAQKSPSFNPGWLELETFCQDLVEEVSFTTSNSQIDIEFVKVGNCTTVCMDEIMLRQILLNLLSNALKYSPNGETVRLVLECSEADVQLQVQDQGMGIPAADVSRLFESFHWASNVSTIRGIGLGLAIVKKCVELHGGEISVESTVDVGTTFTITLPLVCSLLFNSSPAQLSQSAI